MTRTPTMNDPNSARIAGALLAALLVGLISALATSGFVARRGKPVLAGFAFLACLAAGFLFGLLGAAPMSALFCGVAAIDSTPRRAKAKKGAVRVPRMHIPEPVDF